MSSEDPGRDDLAASITELQNLLLATSSTEEFLQEVAVLAARTVAEGIVCGITLQPDGRPLTVATSDLQASKVDEVQYDLADGRACAPCTPASGSISRTLPPNSGGADFGVRPPRTGSGRPCRCRWPPGTSSRR